MDADARNELRPELGDDEAPRKERVGNEQTNTEVFHVDLIALGLHLGTDLQLLGIDAARLHQRALTVPRLVGDDLDDDTGKNNGDRVADGDRRCHHRDGLRRRHGIGAFKDLGQGHCAGAHAAAHDGQGDEQQRLDGAVAHDGSRSHTQGKREDQAAEDRGEVTRRRLFQQRAVHAEDRAGDQCGDVKIKERAGRLEKRSDVAHKVKIAGHVVDLRAVLQRTRQRGQEIKVIQKRRTEQDDDRAAAEVGADDGRFFTDLIEDRAQHDHECKAAGHALGQVAGIGCDQHDDGKNRKVVPRKIK